MMALPALIDGEGPILFESLAIIEYLDEAHPNPPLLPGGLKPEPAQSIWSGEGRLDSFAKRRIDVSFFEVTYWYFLVGRRICPGGNAKGR